MNTAARCRSSSLGSCFSRSMARARSRDDGLLRGRVVQPADLGHRIDRARVTRPASQGRRPVDADALEFDRRVEHLGAGILPAPADGVGALGRGQAEDAAAAAGAAYLAGPGALATAAASSASMTVVVTAGASWVRARHSSARAAPAAGQSPRSSAARRPGGGARRWRRSRRVTCGSPSIRRLVISQLLMPEARGAPGVADDQAGAERRRRRRRAATRRAPLHAELQRGDAAVQRRPVVLQPGRHADHLRLDVLGNLEQRVGGQPAVGPAVERRRHGDVQRRRSGDAGAGRRFAARRHGDAAHAERVRRGGPAAAASVSAGSAVERRAGPDDDAEVVGDQQHAVVVAGVEADVRAQADRGVDRLRAGMEEIQRPDVDGPAGEIHARRRRSRHGHGGIIMLLSRCLCRFAVVWASC